MAKPFKFLPDIAIADVAFEAYGKTLNELFEAAAQAVFETMVETSSVKPRQTQEISLNASTIEYLLYDFLSEIVFLKDTKSMVFAKVTVVLQEHNHIFTLRATLQGDTIDPETQKLGNDVKAITLHLFSIRKKGNIYIARVVVDI